jgi:hypothetical protein
LRIFLPVLLALFIASGCDYDDRIARLEHQSWIDKLEASRPKVIPPGKVLVIENGKYVLRNREG